jgi:uncharacterized protein (DUF2384 family)
MGTNERGAAGGDLVARAHEKLLADHGLQFQFIPFQVPQPPSWLSDLIKALQPAGPFLRVVFWILAAAMVIWIVVMIARAVYRRRYEPHRVLGPNLGAEPVILRPEAHKVAALLDEADRLAAEQRYAEAAHVLLFRTIADLEGRRPRTVRPALTSRDIAALEALPGAARAAFRIIAERVEHSFFGGRVLGAGDFATCREAYVAFASPTSWQGGASS